MELLETEAPSRSERVHSRHDDEIMSMTNQSESVRYNDDIHRRTLEQITVASSASLPACEEPPDPPPPKRSEPMRAPPRRCCVFYGDLGQLFAICGFGVGELLFLVFGILALIPAGPFTEKNLAIGISFIVLDILCIAGLFGVAVAMMLWCIFKPILECVGVV